MTNNLLADNYASRGSGIWAQWSVTGTLINNTLASHDALAGSEGIRVDVYTSLSLTNNLIAGHAAGITNTAPASSTISADTNLFWNTSDPITGVNDIRQDPLLTADYHPHVGSPAIDAGLTITWLTTDLEGNSRPQGSGYDVGAFEGEGVWWKLFLPLVANNHPVQMTPVFDLILDTQSDVFKISGSPPNPRRLPGGRAVQPPDVGGKLTMITL